MVAVLVIRALLLAGCIRVPDVGKLACAIRGY